MNGTEIGRIVRVQVQDRSLKVPGPRFRAYDPAGIVPVATLLLDEGGAAGRQADGSLVADVHHRDHPESKHRGDNGISICFTSHYDAMRARFPGGIEDGQAGENLLIESDRTWSEADLVGGLVVRTADGPVRLEQVIVADPCVEFSRWLLHYPETERADVSVADALRFLCDGVRGFYAALEGVPAAISSGDVVELAAR
jgi:hypothetical protein